MEKLELKHIAPYLPYGLKCQLNRLGIFNLDEEYPIPHNDICEITNLVKINDDWEIEISGSGDCSFGMIGLDEIDIFLRPLSDLYKEIDGKVGIVEIAKILSGTIHIDSINGACKNLSYFRCTFEDGIEELIINERCEGWYRSYFDKNQPNTGRNIIDQFEVFTYLFSHHYDIFSLIDKGLAIDKSKIK